MITEDVTQELKYEFDFLHTDLEYRDGIEYLPELNDEEKRILEDTYELESDGANVKFEAFWDKKDKRFCSKYK